MVKSIRGENKKPYLEMNKKLQRCNKMDLSDKYDSLYKNLTSLDRNFRPVKNGLTYNQVIFIILILSVFTWRVLSWLKV